MSRGRRPDPAEVKQAKSNPGRRKIATPPDTPGELTLPLVNSTPPRHLKGKPLEVWNRIAPKFARLNLLCATDHNAFAVYWEVPRKNSKSELMPSVALLALVGDREFGGRGHSLACDGSFQAFFDAMRCGSAIRAHGSSARGSRGFLSVFLFLASAFGSFQRRSTPKRCGSPKHACHAEFSEPCAFLFIFPQRVMTTAMQLILL